jgi:hypothetical protein
MAAGTWPWIPGSARTATSSRLQISTEAAAAETRERKYLFRLHPVLEPVERELARGFRERYLSHGNEHAV